MGLDMYLTGRTFNWHDEETRDGFVQKGVILELGYWRKHPDLHGYIVQTFMGGKDECQEIELTADQIRKIISAVRKDQLPKTSGFFFGESTPDRKRETIEILEKAWRWLEGSTDPVPREFEPVGGGAMVKVMAKDDFANAKESRAVYYQASW